MFFEIEKVRQTKKAKIPKIQRILAFLFLFLLKTVNLTEK